MSEERDDLKAFIRRWFAEVWNEGREAATGMFQQPGTLQK